MNLHGYKIKSKRITRLLEEEKNKEYPCIEKIKRLQNAKVDISQRINNMKTKRSEKKK